MKLTNRLNLPQPIVDAVQNDPYSRGDADISVTQLLAPPRVVALTAAHADEITEDVSDRIYSLQGQLMHALLERANTTGIAERRLTIEVEGWRVSGGMDLHSQDGVLSDYKHVSSYKFKDGKAPAEYEEQLNAYAAILRANGETVKALKIVALLRDWSKMEASRDPSYPQFQVLMVDVPMWAPEVAMKFLRERVILHKQARVELPLCTAEERWAKPTQYAVMKQGNKRAVKLYDDKEEAYAHAATASSFYVEKRPGVQTRCLYYCRVSQFCEQYKLLQEGKDDPQVSDADKVVFRMARGTRGK